MNELLRVLHHQIIDAAHIVTYVKDRQQEAERGLRYLIFFSGYCLHINILYMK